MCYLCTMSYFRNGSPFLIAGPCSAETREQVLATAEGLADAKINLFRAGVWKPRTRPGSFEGNGELALGWLKEAKDTFGIKFTTEVAEPSHVELALTYGADALWVGARTTVNPFQVQKIADALRGVQIPVMVKNPVNPDVDLWLGGIERFEQQGIAHVAAIHRGFSGYASAMGYRNQPNWPIPIELKRRRPELAIICDPSHITGKRSRIAAMAQKAMDMRFDGLMIETHIHPDDAWTDAKQQVTPAQLKEILAELVIRAEYSDDMNAQVQLEHLRQLMDSIDSEIIDLVSRRMELSGEIGNVKKAANMTAYQPARWREIVAATTERASTHGLSPDFILAVYETIHHESIRHQLGILNDTPKAINE